MVDQNMDFFKIVDNFAKTAHYRSIPIIKTTLDFVPKITIAIPTYKRPELLKLALDSALNQTDYSDFEVVIVDNDPERDCETERLLKTYTDKRLCYYKNAENIGMFGNWNRCIELSRGEYLTILNDDDLLSNNYLSTVLVFKDKLKKIDALFVGINVLWESTLKGDDLLIVKEKENKCRKIFPINFLFGNINPGSLGVFFRKETLIKIGGFDDVFYPISDYVFFLNYVAKFKEVYYISNRLAYYRLSVNESLKTNIQVENIRVVKLLKRQFCNKYRNLRYVVRLAMPMFDYVYLKEVCLFSEEFNDKYPNELKNASKNINLINKFSYYFLLFIRKKNKKLSELSLKFK
jgi:glycosyltransferase involved in cell wall biosynthesis